ncbi:E3 ubiquitin-protein ligase SH3RF1-like [Watersipora subatra]|uniref:E3 ubiquitin-protein ligase SH3RF1-like n=1 Tax=Watersipora subatra TaxID=2589382 RepID=UPI00355BCA50
MEVSLLELLKCVVCLEHVEQLRVLPCQHTICLSCVTQLTVREGRFKCPTCNKEHTIPNGGFDQLPVSLVTKQIADILKKEKEVKRKAAAAHKETKLSSQTNPVSALTSGGGFGFVPIKNQSGTSTSQSASSSATAPDVRPKKPSAKMTNKGNGKKVDGKESLPKKEEVERLRRALEAAHEQAEEFFIKATFQEEFLTKMQSCNEEQVEGEKDKIQKYQKETSKLCHNKTIIVNI